MGTSGVPRLLALGIGLLQGPMGGAVCHERGTSVVSCSDVILGPEIGTGVVVCGGDCRMWVAADVGVSNTCTIRQRL